MSQETQYYRGYTIEYVEYGMWHFYPTAVGYYYDGEHDNAQRVSSVTEAKSEIDALHTDTPHVVELHEHRRYAFTSLTEAVDFASFWKGDLYPNGAMILNP